MQLRLRNRGPTPKDKPSFGKRQTSAFEQLVSEAVEVQKRLNTLDQPLAYSPLKPISGAAFLRETLALAKSSQKRINQLRKAVDTASAASATLRRMVTFICGPNCKLPPTREDRLRTLSNDATSVELAQLGNYSTSELFALAVQIATERHPEVFGEVDSSQDFAGQVIKLKARQAELFAQIAVGWTADDVLAGDRQAPPAFKLAPDVSIAPAADAAERLVKALVSRAN